MADAALKKAKKDWMAAFNGARITLPSKVHSPIIRHMLDRTLDQLGRNAHYISVTARVIMGEQDVHTSEEFLERRLNEIDSALTKKVEWAKSIFADAQVGELASFGSEKKDAMVIIISPLQTKFLKICQKADILMQHIYTLWLHGEINDSERTKRELEVKHLLRTVPSSARKMRILIQGKVSEFYAKQETSGPAAAARAEEHDDAGAETTAVEASAGEVMASKPRAKRTKPEAATEVATATANDTQSSPEPIAVAA